MGSQLTVWIALGAALLGGCSGTRVVTHVEQPGGRPGWIPSPNRSHPDFLFVTGTCRDQPDREIGRRCAIGDAQQQIARQVGSARHITVRGSYIKDEYIERRVSAGSRVFDFWVLVAYPRSELIKTEDRIADRAMLGLRCHADTPGACDQQLTALLEAAATSAGLEATPQRIPPELVTDAERARRRAASAHAAKLLLVSLDASFDGSEDGEYFAHASCQLRLLDVGSGKLLVSQEPPRPIKGGHIARLPAVRKALHDCLEWLLTRLRSAPGKPAD